MSVASEDGLSCLSGYFAGADSGARYRRQA